MASTAGTAMTTSGATYVPPTELRTRGKDMQRALNAANFGTSRAIGRGRSADRLYAEAEKEETTNSVSRATQQLRAALLRAADQEAQLSQASSRLRANEEILKTRLAEEQELHEAEKKSLKASEGKQKLVHQQNNDRQRKLEASNKAITLLEMKIRDLQNLMGETNDQEHRTSDHYLGVNRKVRELERELLDLSMGNEKLTSNLEDKVEKADRMFQESEKQKDLCLRGKQQAEVQAVALHHQLSSQAIEKEPLDMKFSDTLEEYHTVKEAMKVGEELHEQSKRELGKRLVDEERANNELVEEIAAKVNVETGLALDLAEEEAAKDVILKQIEDKDGLCLEMGKRLHKLENGFVELSRELKTRDGETEELMKEVEHMKSQSKILNAKLEMEQSSTRKLIAWTQMERLTADGLDSKLNILKTNETSHALTVRQEEAMGARLKDKLEETVKIVANVREELHNCLAQKDYKGEKLKETEEETTHFNVKYSKISGIVEKLHRQLNERTRDFDNKHKVYLLSKNDLGGRVDEKDDEVKRLSSQMAKSDSQVDNMQTMLEESAERAEHERVIKSEEILKLDDINTQYETDLRQQTNHNQLMENDLQNSEERIKFASSRMIANESKAADMAKLNSEELMELQQRLQKETESLHSLQKTFDTNKTDLSRLIAQFDAEDHMKRRLQMNLRQEKHEHDNMSRDLENNKEMELDRVKRVQELEGERDRLQEHMDMKTDQYDSAKGALADSIENLDGLKKDLHAAEIKEADMFSRQTIDQSTIHQHEQELRIQEEQHVTDANAVRLKIVQLQDALQEKVHTVEKLDGAVTAMRQRASSLQIRLEQTESESSHCQTSFERMLDEEQNEVAIVRTSSEKMSRKIMSLRQFDLTKDEGVCGLQSKLGERQSENETLISEAYRKDRQAHNDGIDVARLTVKERDMVESVDDLSETIVELKLQKREHCHSEQELHRALVEMENENKFMKHQIQEKMKAERALLLQLEASRHHVNDNTGHAEADKHAEEALEKLLHSETDAALF